MGERSKVYMTDLRCRPGVSLLNKLEKLMRTAGIGEINFERKLVAIKMHFGEPGNLDVHNSMEIMELLEEINRRGTTVLVVTHSREIVAEMGKRVITLTRGVLTGDQKGGIWHEN